MRRGKSSDRKVHRIRLSDPEIDVIHRALDFFEANSRASINDEDNWRELSEALRNVRRRFHWINEGIKEGNLDPQGLPRSC